MVRMTTVVEPALFEIFSRDALRPGLPVRGSEGYGSLNGTRTVRRTRCRTGQVVFVVELTPRTDPKGPDLTRALLPGCVAAEAERIGCGPERLTLPPV